MRAPRWETKRGLNKGIWSQEEDQKLVGYIRKYGIWNWCKMPQYAGLARTGRSCRVRWLNYLNPNIKHRNFTKAEDETTLHFHSILSNRWSVIAGKLPGRSDDEVKNHWHTNFIGALFVNFIDCKL